MTRHLILDELTDERKKLMCPPPQGSCQSENVCYTVVAARRADSLVRGQFGAWRSYLTSPRYAEHPWGGTGKLFPAAWQFLCLGKEQSPPSGGPLCVHLQHSAHLLGTGSTLGYDLGGVKAGDGPPTTQASAWLIYFSKHSLTTTPPLPGIETASANYGPCLPGSPGRRHTVTNPRRANTDLVPANVAIKVQTAP